VLPHHLPVLLHRLPTAPLGPQFWGHLTASATTVAARSLPTLACLKAPPEEQVSSLLVALRSATDPQ